MKNKQAEEAVSSLIHSLLKGDITRLVSIHHKLLTEVLCNGKTFAELKDVVNLNTTRQKTIFEDAVLIVNAHIKNTNEKLASYDKMEKELIELRHWKHLLESHEVKENKKNISSKMKKMLSQRIRALNFSGRVKNICYHNGIITLADLVVLSPKNILSVRNAGKKTIDEIQDYFIEHGLDWEMDI